MVEEQPFRAKDVLLNVRFSAVNQSIDRAYFQLSPPSMTFAPSRNVSGKARKPNTGS